MALQTAIGYLVALSAPLWLVFEAIMKWRRSAEVREKPIEAGHRCTAPEIAGAAANRREAPTRAHARTAA